MAVDATVIQNKGPYTLYQWTLTSADSTANPVPAPMGHRSEKTVKMFGTVDAAGWNTATIQMQGDVELSGTDFLVVRDEQGNDAELTGANGLITILQNVSRIKPVVTAGALGATGVTITLLCTSALPRLH